jgi:DNA-binding CsgD family transcriptional regulator
VPRPTILTTRERQIADLLLDGFTNPEIARTLHISARTVQSHLEQARVKVGARNRTHLAALLLRRGIVPLDPESAEFRQLAD